MLGGCRVLSASAQGLGCRARFEALRLEPLRYLGSHGEGPWLAGLAELMQRLPGCTHRYQDALLVPDLLENLERVLGGRPRQGDLPTVCVHAREALRQWRAGGLDAIPVSMERRKHSRLVIADRAVDIAEVVERRRDLEGSGLCVLRASEPCDRHVEAVLALSTTPG